MQISNAYLDQREQACVCESIIVMVEAVKICAKDNLEGTTTQV